MYILIVDDEASRHEALGKKYAHQANQIWHAKSYAEAIELLEQRRYDVISLDHDLGEAKTGADITRYMVREMKFPHKPKQVLIHTRNPVGAGNMAADLREAGIRYYFTPFTP